jgi:hypothetical protein
MAKSIQKEVDNMTAQIKKKVNRLLVILMVIALALVFTAPLNGSYAANNNDNTYAKLIKTSVGSLSPKFNEDNTSYTIVQPADQDETDVTLYKAANKTVKTKKGKITTTTKTEVDIQSKVGSDSWSDRYKMSKLTERIKLGQGETEKMKFKVNVKKTVKTVNSKTGKTKTKSSSKARVYNVTINRDEDIEIEVPELPDSEPVVSEPAPEQSAAAPVITPTPPEVIPDPVPDTVPGVAKYTLTVNGGTGSGQYENVELVHIVAIPQEGKTFLGWGYSVDPMIDSLDGLNAYIHMTPRDLEVTANFWPPSPTAPISPEVTKYTLLVSGGTGSGQYEAGELVRIRCSLPTWTQFTGWESPYVDVIDDGLDASVAYVRMPSQDAYVTATYQPLPYQRP